MENNKIEKKMKKSGMIIVLMLFSPAIVFAQEYLSEEQEEEIKLTGKYYWKESSGSEEAIAYQYALNGLTDRIISEVIYQTKKREEVLKELEMRAYIGRIRQEGSVCVLAWIAKDSVFVTIQRPLNPPQVSDVPRPVDTHVEPPVSTPQPDADNNDVTDVILQELINCKNYKEVNKVANRRGLVKGEMNTSEGFGRPDLCYIAVFDPGWSLVALLDKGGTSRMDLKSGQTIQNPESYYQNKGYNLWYLQRK